MCVEQTERNRYERTNVISESVPYSHCADEKTLLVFGFFFLHFLETNTVTFVLLLDLVALEATRLVGITVGLTLNSPVTDLKKKHI